MNTSEITIEKKNIAAKQQNIWNHNTKIIPLLIGNNFHLPLRRGKCPIEQSSNKRILKTKLSHASYSYLYKLCLIKNIIDEYLSRSRSFY
jgi:hypothetical protein